MKYKAVFWDFDGVWSKDFFYKSFIKEHPQIWNFVQTKVWGPGGEGKVDKWMRAELNMNDINKFISQGTGMNFNVLNKKFLHDVALMEIEMRHIPIVEELKENGVNVGMITNNMDVFSTITVPKLHLKELFDNNVYNSFDHKVLKAEGLFDIAMHKSGLTKYSEVLLIDDSQRARTAFENKGGQTYAYTTFVDFEAWAKKNLLI